MMRMRILGPLVVGVALLVAPSAKAEDTPKGLWLKVKCALCHGEDGASQTPQGKSTKAPDLRVDEIQDLSDDDLSKRIAEGHAKMPSFKIKLTQDQIRLLVFYIREIGEKGAKE